MERPEDRFEQNREYFKLITDEFEEVDLKGKKMPFTSLNGHMFAYIDPKGSFALRLERQQLEDFLKEHNTERDVQHGRVMKEYAKVPDELLADWEQIMVYFASSLEYVKSLKPKK